jgi:hypothetical protein
MVNIDHEVVFRASTLVHHELQPHDICFKFTVKPVKKCDKFTVSSSIYVPSAHSRILSYKKESEFNYCIDVRGHDLLSQANEHVTRNFLWNLNIHNKPVYVESDYDEVRIYCSRETYIKQTTKVGTCYAILINQRSQFIKDAMDSGKFKLSRNEKKSLSKSKKTNATLGNSYVIVYGDRHPLNHVSKTYFPGATICSAASLNQYSPLGLYEACVPYFKKIFAENKGLSAWIRSIPEVSQPCKAKVPENLEVFKPIAVRHAERFQITVDDDFYKEIVPLVTSFNYIQNEVLRAAGVCLYTITRSYYKKFKCSTAKITAFVKLGNPILKTVMPSGNGKPAAPKVIASKEIVLPVLIKLPEITITQHYTDYKINFTDTKVTDGYYFKIKLAKFSELLNYAQRLKDYIYKKWFASLVIGFCTGKCLVRKIVKNWNYFVFSFFVYLQKRVKQTGNTKIFGTAGFRDVYFAPVFLNKIIS